MNIEQARFNMVEQQIRPWEVLDPTILELISRIPRENFVPTQYQHLAFSDSEIPLAHEQVMMMPKLEARMLQALNIQAHESVLEIGTGSGFVTALLSQLAEQVSSEELYADLSSKAAQKLADLELDKNVKLIITDSLDNRAFFERFDVIVITASMPSLDTNFQQQLKIGGRLFAIVGKAPVMEAGIITRLSEREWQEQTLFETSVPALIGATEINTFQL